MSIMDSSYHRYNVRDQQIAASGLSTPQDIIAILLHRLVLLATHPEGHIAPDISAAMVISFRSEME
jgi:hypothetical protein